MTKKTNRIFFAALFLLLVLFQLQSMPSKAVDPLDEIKSYVITVDMREDGTMDIQYHLDWLVLDDTAEGPLTWVKIGIPNKHVDNMQALSQNISGIRYLSDSGSYVRIDFDRPYRAGETVAFDFSTHQSHMYMNDRSTDTCSYTFIPGWFEEIRVDSLKVLWNEADVASSNATGTEGEYLIWETSLDAGERYDVLVKYPDDVFITLDSMQANQDNGEDVPVLGIIVLIGLLIVGIWNMINRYRSGFGGGGPYGGGAHHTCACAGGCACACACAGGGRAGCSAKNFYGAKVSLSTLREKLNE